MSRDMETQHFRDWSDGNEMSISCDVNGQKEILNLTWHNTQVFTYQEGDGKYDYLQHVRTQAGPIFFWLENDNPLKDELILRYERRPAPAKVEPAVLFARYQDDFKQVLTRYNRMNDFQL
jgi:hypothetical protein